MASNLSPIRTASVAAKSANANSLSTPWGEVKVGDKLDDLMKGSALHFGKDNRQNGTLMQDYQRGQLQFKKLSFPDGTNAVVTQDQKAAHYVHYTNGQADLVQRLERTGQTLMVGPGTKYKMTLPGSVSIEK